MSNSSGVSKFAAAARRAAVSAFLASFLFTSGVSGASADIAEYQLKAAFLYNFAQFIEWPLADGAKPFVISILGRDPFGAHIDALRDVNVMNRPIEVRRIHSLDDLNGSDMLFIGDPAPEKMSAILRRLKTNSVVTVGEAAGFVEQGGVICFKFDSNKVRFEINKKAADEKGIKISSKLLSLAARVVD
jgi:hypothetical protein